MIAAIPQVMNLAAAIRMRATLTVVIKIGVTVTTLMALTRITLERVAALAAVVIPVTLVKVRVAARKAAKVTAKAAAKVVEKATAKVAEKATAKTNSQKLLLLGR